MAGEPPRNPYGPAWGYPQSGHPTYPPAPYSPGGAYVHPGPYPSQAWGPMGPYAQNTRPPGRAVWSTRTTMLAIAAALVISSLGAVAAAAADKAPSTTERITGFQLPGNGSAGNGFPGSRSMGGGSTGSASTGTGFGGNGGFGGGFGTPFGPSGG